MLERCSQCCLRMDIIVLDAILFRTLPTNKDAKSAFAANLTMFDERCEEKKQIYFFLFFWLGLLACVPKKREKCRDHWTPAGGRWWSLKLEGDCSWWKK